MFNKDGDMEEDVKMCKSYRMITGTMWSKRNMKKYEIK